jgi:uncharacterized protein (DUF58 family)
MTLAQLLETVRSRRLSLDTITRDLQTGSFRSVFRGQGIEFDELREYQWGDYVRLIDRNVSARLSSSPFSVPWVKRYREERDFSIFFVIDNSLSMDTGAGPVARRDQKAICTAILAFAAEKAGSSIGAAGFSSKVDRLIPPAKGRRQLLSILELALGPAEKQLPGSCLAQALQAVSRLRPRKSLIVILSDFQTNGWEEDLSRLSFCHDVLALNFCDCADYSFPDIGTRGMVDPESGISCLSPGTTGALAEAWTEWHSKRRAYISSVCASKKIRYAEISTDEDPAMILHNILSAGIGR